MIHRPRGHARTRCLVWSQQSPLEFFQYGSGRPCARVSRVLTKATSYLIALSLQPKEVGNDNRAEVKNDGLGSGAPEPVRARAASHVRFRSDNDRTGARRWATHFLMKRLPKVAAEMALHVLAYNL